MPNHYNKYQIEKTKFYKNNNNNFKKKKISNKNYLQELEISFLYKFVKKLLQFINNQDKLKVRNTLKKN